MLENKKVVFMGTPHFAERVLACLLENNVNIVAVVTQPDKPVGRKKILTPSEVKVLALNHHIPVIQPQKIRKEYEEVLAYQPDLIITAAFGQFIPNAILDYCLCINVHGSLLPKYRGGAPMQRAIMANEKETGITIMTMGEKMDNGDMISQDKIIIEENDTLTSVEEKLIEVACPLLIRTLQDIENNTAVFTKQKDEEATFAYVISKEEEFLSFEKENYTDFYNHARALIEAPYGYIVTQDGVKLKVCALHTSDKETDKESGTVLGLIDKSMAIALDQKMIFIDELIPEGKNRMKSRDYLNGAGRNLPGSKLL